MLEGWKRTLNEAAVATLLAILFYNFVVRPLMGQPPNVLPMEIFFLTGASLSIYSWFNKNGG